MERIATDVPPLPGDQSLVFDVTCRTGAGQRGRTHPIEICPDWRVDTGHDLDAERIAAAFGGYLSCLDVVDTLIPAFRHGLRLRRRVDPPHIRRDQQGWVVADPVPSCRCSKARTRTARSLKDAATAAGHERSTHHLARRFAANEKQLEVLFAAADDGYDGLGRLLAHPEAEALVMERFGLLQLWEAGISPERIVEIHRQLWSEQGAVPARLYLSFGTYLDAAEWSPWHHFGLPILDIEQLLGCGLGPEDVESVARATLRTPRQVGSVLAAWVRAGCGLEQEDLCAMLTPPHHRWPVPSRQAIDRVQSEVGLLQVTRTQVGLVLAVAGTPVHAIRAMRDGARDPNEAYRYLATKGLM